MFYAGTGVLYRNMSAIQYMNWCGVLTGRRWQYKDQCAVYKLLFNTRNGANSDCIDIFVLYRDWCAIDGRYTIQGVACYTGTSVL